MKVYSHLFYFKKPGWHHSSSAVYSQESIQETAFTQLLHLRDNVWFCASNSPELTIALEIMAKRTQILIYLGGYPNS